MVHRRFVSPLVILTVLALGLAACGTEAEPTAVPARLAPAPAQAEPAPASPAVVAAKVSKPKQYDAAPPMTIDPNKKYTATMVMEKGGEIVIELFAKEAPVTINSFVFLAREGFYDGLTFHRVIPDFMAQGGDPTGTGSGGPGYRFDNELSPDRRHDGPGVLSMANSGLRNGKGTNGSQFFITLVATLFLDGYRPDGGLKDCTRESCHTVFGKVIGGMDVVSGIAVRDPGTARSPGDAIKTITIEESSGSSGRGSPGQRLPEQPYSPHVEPGQEHPPYNSVPAASGWHYPFWANWGVHNDVIPNEVLVHNLEHGGVGVHYN